MPKEYIESRWFGQTAKVLLSDSEGEDRYEDRVIEDSAVKVGWNRDLHVELAVVPCVDGSFDDLSDRAQHIQMDRAGLNRLIQTLRKARDAAFGKDQ